MVDIEKSRKMPSAISSSPLAKIPTAQASQKHQNAAPKCTQSSSPAWTAMPKEHLFKQFDVPHSEFLLEKDIPLSTPLCEPPSPAHSSAKAHIAYLPNDRVVGLSKLARTVEVYARRLQLQEQMTTQIADDIMRHLDARGVMVVIEAEHLCMTMRGVKKPGAKTITTCVRGAFEEQAELRATVLSLIRQ